MTWHSSRAIPLVWILAACSAPAPPPAYRQAVRQERRGRHEEALRTYAHVEATARYRRFRVEAGMRRAALLARLGRCREAVSAYRNVAAHLARRPRDAARALFRAGVVSYDCLHEVRPALRLWRRVVLRYPGTVAAEDALARFVALLRKQRRYDSLLRFLNRVARSVPPGDLWATAVWLASRVSLHDLKDRRQALALCGLLATRLPSSPLADDALFCAGRLSVALGRPRRALVWYRKLLRTRTKAWIVGSYNSQWLDDAQLAVGKIYLDDLNDWKRAHRAFLALAEEFEDSVLRDDGLWWACLALLRGGKVREAMRLWHRLSRQFPESRFVRQEKALRDWAPVAEALARRDRPAVCAALQRHAARHPFGWFAARRRALSRRFRCPGT